MIDSGTITIIKTARGEKEREEEENGEREREKKEHSRQVMIERTRDRQRERERNACLVKLDYTQVQRRKGNRFTLLRTYSTVDPVSYLFVYLSRATATVELRGRERCKPDVFTCGSIHFLSLPLSLSILFSFVPISVEHRKLGSSHCSYGSKDHKRERARKKRICSSSNYLFEDEARDRNG